MSSGAVKVTVFTFGPLGSAIVNALTSHQYANHFAVTVVLPPEMLEAKEPLKLMQLAKYKAANLPLIGIDLDKATNQELVTLINGSEAVISTLGFRHKESTTTPDHKLLEAVKTAKVKYFIPNIFSSDILSMDAKLIEMNPLLKLKKQLIDDVQKSGVNYIMFITGTFLEFLISPFGGVDFDHCIVTAPGSFDTKITASSMHDTGILVAEALMQRHQSFVKNHILKLGSDTFTWNDIHLVLEERFKTQFKKQIVTKEDLEKQVQADMMKHNLFVRFWLLWTEGKGVNWDLKQGFQHEHCKQLHLTKMKEYIMGIKDESLALIKEQAMMMQQQH